MTIADWCLECDITVAGTLKADRKGIPKEMKKPSKDDPERDPKSTKWCYNGKKMLVSYADSKKVAQKLYCLSQPCTTQYVSPKTPEKN